MKNFLFLLVFALCGQAHASHDYKYNDLQIRDYDEMSKQVQDRIQKADDYTNKDNETEDDDRAAIAELRDALKLIFSRPNSDNMVAKLITDIRRELGGLNAFEDSIAAVANDALITVKDSGQTVNRRATALFVLDNIMAEIRPQAGDKPDFRRVIQRIADAKIKIADDVKRDLALRSMYRLQNPSETAEKILKTLPKEKKK